MQKKILDYFPGFILFRVIVKRRDELFASIFLMLGLMLFASICIYFFERSAQPKAFATIYDAMWWSVAALTTVGYGDVYPITPMGRIFGAVIAMCGIGMFALPAGILGSGFVDEIELKKKNKEMQEKSATIQSAFRYESSVSIRGLVDRLNLPSIRKILDVEYAMASLQFSQEEIFEAVAFRQSLRIRACKKLKDSLYEDNFVIESFPVNTSFGSMIDRGSNVHLISSQSVVSLGAGHFSRSLAHALNANYYSNEFFSTSTLRSETLINFAVNELFHEIDLSNIPQPFGDWRNAFERHIKQDDLVIYIGTYSSLKNHHCHVLCGGEKGQLDFKEVKAPTFTNMMKIEQFYNDLSQSLSELEMTITSHSTYANNNPNHLTQVLRQKNKANVVSIYLSALLLEFTPPELYYTSIRTLADSITRCLLDSKLK